MSKQTGIVVAVLAVIAIVAGVITYVVMAGSATGSEVNNTTTQQDSANTTPTPNDSAVQLGNDEASTRSTVEVVFTDSGFDKETYTLKAGEALLIKNNSGETLQLASDDHPTHTLNGELNAPAIGPGETTQLTPTTPGTYGVHDHIRSQFTAMIEVTE